MERETSQKNSPFVIKPKGHRNGHILHFVYSAELTLSYLACPLIVLFNVTDNCCSLPATVVTLSSASEAPPSRGKQ